jgi:hypothetical protein
VKFFYAKFLPDGGIMTLQYWKRQTTDTAKPQTAVESLQVSVGHFEPFEAISAMLQIFATLPVTTATGERSFSELKYLKNYLR